MKYQYEPLSDEYEFQAFLKDLFNAMYNTDSFQEYGSKGMKQYGIDIYSPVLRIGIQAKKKDINRAKANIIKELENEMQETLGLIDGFPHELQKIYFATTTNRVVSLQNLCMSHTSSGNKQVHFFCWLDIQMEIAKFPIVRNKYYPDLKENRLDSKPFGFNIQERLDFLEKLIREQQAALAPKKKEYRAIPDCEVLLPRIDIDAQRLLIRFMLKAAAVQTFKNATYKKFRCIINFSHSHTQFGDGVEGPGFQVFSGEIVFLSNINKFMNMFQHNTEEFWKVYDEYQNDDYYNNLRYRMKLLQTEGLTSYDLEYDEQTSIFQIKPVDHGRLDYENLNSLNAVMPFICATTHFSFQIIEFDELRGFNAITKFIYRLLSKDNFRLNDIHVNVHDFDDWDYAYKFPDWHGKTSK